jgi:hypothetical protein
MVNTEVADPNGAANTTNTPSEFSIKPLRTMRGDLAELLSKNTLTPAELKSIHAQLKSEAEAYHAQGGDGRYLENLLPKKEQLGDLYSAVKGSGGKPQEDADLFIQKSTADIIADQIPKARQKTEELKKTLTPGVQTMPGPVQVVIAKPLNTAPAVRAPIAPVQKAPVPPPREVIDPLIAEEKELAQAFATLPQKEAVLAGAAQKLADERATFEKLLAPLRDEECVLEERENSLHLEEARAENQAARRHLEEERWNIEDRRRAVEQKRWKVDQEIIRIQNDVNRLTAEKQAFAGTRAALEEKKALLEKKKRARTAQDDYKRLQATLAQFAPEKEPLEIAWIELSEKRKATLNELETTRTRERTLEETITEADIAERKTQTPEERHTHEARRWKGEEERRTLERKRWQLEDSLIPLETSMKELKEKYQKILAREHETKKQMEDLQKLINEVRTLK